MAPGDSSPRKTLTISKSRKLNRYDASADRRRLHNRRETIASQRGRRVCIPVRPICSELERALPVDLLSDVSLVLCAAVRNTRNTNDFAHLSA